LLLLSLPELHPTVCLPQNMNLKVSCICRGVPVPTGPEFTIPRICPNVAGLEESASGSPHWARLKRLNTSPRNCIWNRSPSGICLRSPRSACQRLGPRAMLRGALPYPEPGTGVNAARLIQLRRVRPPGGVSETPAIRFGRWLVVYPVATEVLERSSVTLTGRPVRAVTGDYKALMIVWSNCRG
jgi:hypothetical protein